MKILKSSLVASIVGLILYAVVTAVFWKAPAAVIEGEPAEDPMLARAKSPSWEFYNPEADALINELKLEKETLVKREKELNDLADRLQTERLELNIVTQAIHQLQSQFEATIVRLNAEESVNIKKLARTYAAMAPEGAAPIMKELEENTLTKILAVMKETESAPILEAMSKLGPEEARRVAKVTERLRFYLSQTKDVKKPNP
jgi:flagellar motility protein MotE (MotC chaperone)